MTKTTLSYVGKQVNIGIDVHKKSYKICAVMDGEVIKKWSSNASAEALIDSLKKFFQGAKIKTVYEAGFSGFALHRKLVEAGITNIVVNPSSIEIAANDRVKTDKRDAQKMAIFLSQGRLKGIHVPSVEEELMRLIPRTREQLVEHRTAVGNQIKAKLHQFGLIDYDDDRVMSASYLEIIAKKSLKFELKLVLEELADEWKSLSKRIKRFDKEMEKQAEKDADREKILRSVPGIGPVSSRTLSTELGDMKRFKNERELFSFTGLTPSEYSTGEHVRRGHISRQGPGRIRDLLVEAAWRAIDEDINLKRIYERIKGKRGGKIAIVAVARRLIGRIRACLRKGFEYGVAVAN